MRQVHNRDELPGELIDYPVASFSVCLDGTYIPCIEKLDTYEIPGQGSAKGVLLEENGMYFGFEDIGYTGLNFYVFAQDRDHLPEKNYIMEKISNMGLSDDIYWLNDYLFLKQKGDMVYQDMTQLFELRTAPKNISTIIQERYELKEDEVKHVMMSHHLMKEDYDAKLFLIS